MEILNLLLEHGADVNTIAENGWTALHMAASQGRTRAVKMLIDKGADLDCRTGKPKGWYSDGRPTGQTPLLLALRSGYLHVAQLLIDRGADVNGADETGKTALLLAAGMALRVDTWAIAVSGIDCGSQGVQILDVGLRNANRRLADCLLSHGANANARDEDGATPLHHAARNGDEAIAELLLAHGSQINAADDEGTTPLHEAARVSNGMVALLLSHGAAVGAANRRGNTPLHDAVLRGHREIAELLLAHNADANAKNNGGRTPLDEANRRRHAGIIQLLTAKAETSSAASPGQTEGAPVP
jgi:ankyrin repeat protein